MTSIKQRLAGAAACAALCAVLAGCGGGSDDADGASAIERGWKHFSDSEYATALKDFEAAELLAEDDMARQEACFAQGLIWHVRTRPDNDQAKARAKYSEAIDICPTNDIAAWADLWRARVASEVVLGDYPPAKERYDAYAEVAARHPDHPAGEEATLCMYTIRLEADTDEENAAVREELLKWLDEHPDSKWRQTAYTLLATADKRVGDMRGRYDATLQVWNTRYINPAHPDDDPSLIDWQLATIAEFDVGDLELAALHYRAFIDRFPHHQRTFLALQELRKIEKALGVEGVSVTNAAMIAPTGATRVAPAAAKPAAGESAAEDKAPAAEPADEKPAEEEEAGNE